MDVWLSGHLLLLLSQSGRPPKAGHLGEPDSQEQYRLAGLQLQAGMARA